MGFCLFLNCSCEVDPASLSELGSSTSSSIPDLAKERTIPGGSLEAYLRARETWQEVIIWIVGFVVYSEHQQGVEFCQMPCWCLWP